MNTKVSVSGFPGTLFGLPAELLQVILLTVAAAQVLLALFLAIAVKLDAEQRQRRAGALFLVPPWAWFAIVLLTGGYLGSLAYWLVHYSALRGPEQGHA